MDILVMMHALLYHYLCQFTICALRSALAIMCVIEIRDRLIVAEILVEKEEN